ncbi:MAG: isoleucine--tRNA ligase [Alphaproteobacteria bacterium]|nr:isoleucine--tRNA ligase [Alphaproteobacteria bacterium]
MNESHSTSGQEPAARDYRGTLFLPATDFPMKANLPAAEPKWLERWERMDLYGRLRAANKGRPLFVLHDGPPYANGEIHSGTGLNKVLKDIVVRSRGFLGYDAPYIPGWDCHGLPIEWKIEEKYRKEGKSKDDVPIARLRQDCREFAEHWIDVQRRQFKRLGCIGLWDKPYTTMDYRAEAVIAAELHKFVAHKLLYRGFRPVMWSPVEKTALAEAEVEYHEKTSPTIYVRFPVLRHENKASAQQLDGASVIIWTTTPWTIPANRAIAWNTAIRYVVLEVREIAEGSFARVGEKLIVAASLAQTVKSHAKITEAVEWPILGTFRESKIVCGHPFRELDSHYGFDVPLLWAEHVTDDTGTGFVHTAPGHGEDDFRLYELKRSMFPANTPNPFNTVAEDGTLTSAVHLPSLIGKFILSRDGKKDGDANGAVIQALIDAGALLAKGTLRHQYPHSWRSKAPVIFRATPQWFAAMDKEIAGGGTLRQRAMKAIADTRWFPPSGENRIAGMVKDRPDWVLSRQRAWGVPLAIFVDRKTQEILDDADVNARIVDAFKSEGADAWFNSPPSRFLGNGRNPDDYEQVKDILDVWFDSGSTHVFTVEQPLEPQWPQKDHADLYLEGSDQHRGWFQSSLLESCATRGRAPYDEVLTAGFVLDREGDKMSKSVGNVILPQAIADKNGADIFRLWVAASDFTQDMRMGNDIVQANSDAYRRLRNTVRFMLANLAGYEESERASPGEMPELERYMLARLAELDAIVRESYTLYDFNRVYNSVFSFCTNECSAFYFDIRKDALYCDARTAPRRRAARTVLDEIFRRVATWLAPILCFTMEEAWLLRFPGENDSVHLQTFLDTPEGWRSAELIAKWNRIRAIRRVVTGALEVARRDKVIGASLEAAPLVYLEDTADRALLEGIDLAEIAITSGAHLARVAAPDDAFRLEDVPGVAVRFEHARGDKCARCWMILEEVGANPRHRDLCNRCAGAVG